MYKTVLHDYRYHLKEGFDNLDGTSWFVYIYPIWLLPALSGMGSRMATVFICALVPLYFSLALSRMYGGQIDKTLFLCPMSREDRRRYVKTGMRIRIGIGVGIFLVLHVILAGLGWISLPMFGAKLVVMVLAAVSFNIYCQPDQKSAYGTKRRYPLSGNYEIWNILAQGMGIANMMLLSLYEENERLWELILTGAAVLLQLGVCIQIIRKFYRQVLERAVCYETGRETDNRK